MARRGYRVVPTIFGEQDPSVADFVFFITFVIIVVAIVGCVTGIIGTIYGANYKNNNAWHSDGITTSLTRGNAVLVGTELSGDTCTPFIGSYNLGPTSWDGETKMYDDPLATLQLTVNCSSGGLSELALTLDLETPTFYPVSKRAVCLQNPALTINRPTSCSGPLIGINNANPQYTLDVAGNANINGSMNVAGKSKFYLIVE